MKPNNIKLGVFGFGCVGQGLYEVLQQTKGLKAEIVKICVKNTDKKRSIDSEYFTYDKHDLLDDPDINVIVELIDDPDAAYEIVTSAVRNGKAVVTANKKMVAEHFEELFELQREFKVPLLHEAAVCASIPIIRNLEEYYDNDLMNAVEGIFNGSTNYILTKIFEEGMSFETALKEAQNKGYAETDPSLDIEGYDPKYKLVIIMAHAFGLFKKPEALFNFGIHKLNDFDIRYAKEKGFKVKLIAQCRKVESKVFAAITPQFIKPDHKLYNIDNEYNGVIVEGAFSETQFFVGKGAGSYPTGSAVLSDISALTYNYGYEFKKHFQELDLEYSENFLVEVYVRYKKKGDINLSDFDTITEKHQTEGCRYIIGKIPFSKLTTANWLNHKDVNLILTEKSRPEVI